MDSVKEQRKKLGRRKPYGKEKDVCKQMDKQVNGKTYSLYAVVVPKNSVFH